MTELVAVKKIPESLSNRGWPDLDLAEPFMDYEDAIEISGIAERVYQSETFIEGKKPGQCDIFEWVILTEKAAQTPKTQLRKRTRTFVKTLKEAVNKLGLPIRVHSTLIAPEEEYALKDHLKKNGILFSWRDFNETALL